MKYDTGLHNTGIIVDNDNELVFITPSVTDDL